VIAGDGEDRPGIVAVRLVELVVVILRLAEVVDHVSEVIQEAGPVRDSGRVNVVGNLVEDADLITIFADVGTSRVAQGVKHDPAVLLDLLDDLWPSRAKGARQFINFLKRDARLFETDDVLEEKLLDDFVLGVVRRVPGREVARVRTDHTFAEDGFVE
jgi:hypothetical protein